MSNSIWKIKQQTAPLRLSESNGLASNGMPSEIGWEEFFWGAYPILHMPAHPSSPLITISLPTDLATMATSPMLHEGKKKNNLVCVCVCVCLTLFLSPPFSLHQALCMLTPTLTPPPPYPPPPTHLNPDVYGSQTTHPSFFFMDKTQHLWFKLMSGSNLADSLPELCDWSAIWTSRVHVYSFWLQLTHYYAQTWWETFPFLFDIEHRAVWLDFFFFFFSNLLSISLCALRRSQCFVLTCLPLCLLYVSCKEIIFRVGDVFFVFFE